MQREVEALDLFIRADAQANREIDQLQDDERHDRVISNDDGDADHLIDDLASRGTGIVIVSLDLTEILGMCDRILVLRQGRIVADLERSAASKQTILAYAGGGDPA